MTADTWTLGKQHNRLRGGIRAAVVRARASRAKMAAVVVLGALVAWGGVAATRYMLSDGTGPGIGGAGSAAGQGPSLPRYLGSLDGPFKPLGVAVAPDGRAYVTGGREVAFYTAEGKRLGVFAAPASAGASAPVYIAVSPAGEVFVSDIGPVPGIHVFTADGTYLRDLESPFAEGWAPLGVAFDPEGHLYVTEVTPGKHRVLVFDRNGFLVDEFGRQGTAEGEFWFPNTVAFDARGRIYVADGNNARVQVFSATHEFLASIPVGAAAGAPGIPRGIAVDAARATLFVVDAGGQGVEMYDVSGDAPYFSGAFGRLGGDDLGFAYPNGIALAPGGRILVTDREHDRVQTWSY